MILPLVIEPAELANALGLAPAGAMGSHQATTGANETVRVIDVRSSEAYATGHLPGAVHLEPVFLNRADPPVNGLPPDLQTATQLLGRLGIEPGQTLVACDGGGESAAARLVWVLYSLGVTRCSFLNGGVKAWVASGQSLVHEVPEISPSAPALSASAAHRISVEALMARLSDTELTIVDTRSQAEYAGTDVRSAMGGHVPGAVHLEWTRLLDAQGCLLERDDLERLFDTASVPRNRPIVVYCQTHQRSAVTWLALKWLGADDVRAIDGAWSAWGNRADTPKSLQRTRAAGAEQD